MTDRFAPADDYSSTLPTCDPLLGPYCGGTWRGIMDNLDYIQGMNFDAVWISPVVANLPQLTIDGQSYAGYWQQDLYSLNDKFGTQDDLLALIEAIHSRGMFFMMDIVVNHMGFSGAVPSIDYSILNPFNDPKYYHNYCEMDYSAKNVTSLEECWLGSWYVPLADLRTEDQVVQEMFGEWIEQMVSNYSIDGLRLDGGANVEPGFFSSFVEKAGVFATAEVYLSNDTTACAWQDTVGSIINYPIYWPLTAAFQSGGNFSDLTQMIGSVQSTCKDTTLLGTFSENQDVPRFANSTSDMSLAKNVATYVLMSDGIPIIYQGQEQHLSGGTDPFTNREPLWQSASGLSVFAPLYDHIATLNTLRRHAMQTSPNFTMSTTSIIHQDDNCMAMSRGSGAAQIITVLTNAGESSSNSELQLSISGYSSGTQFTDALSCNNYTVSGNGSITLPMTGGLPTVLYPAASLSNSSLCGMGGQMFEGKEMVTMTTMSTTINGTPTATVVAATLPVVSATTTAASAPTSSKGAASGPQIPTSPQAVVPVMAIALAFSSGVAGALLRLLA